MLDAARIRAAAIADKYIPATDREVAPTDNAPPAELVLTDVDAVKAYADAVMATKPSIDAAMAHGPLLKAFIADNPVVQNAEEAQKTYAWIESTRRTLAAMEDERKPRIAPLNAASETVNGPYRPMRKRLEELLEILIDRWNVWDKAERRRREAEAARLRLEAEAAERTAAEAIRVAEEAIANAELGECADVGGAVEHANIVASDAGKIVRVAARAERATHVRVASSLGGKAGSSRKKTVVVIDDWVAAIKAIGLTEKIETAIRQSAEAFEDAHGELPAGTHAETTRSI